MAVEITGLSTAGAVFLALGVLSILYLIGKKAKTGDWPKGYIAAGTAILALIGLAVVPLTRMTGGQVFWKKKPVAKKGPTGPTEQITKEDVGIVKGTIVDQYQEPTTKLSGVTVDISTTEPSRAEGVDAIQSSTENESYTIQVDHVTSGTVYVVASKDGFYPSVESTTIPGAAEFPSPGLYVTNELAQIENEPTISVDDNSGYVSLNSSTNTIKVDNEATTQAFDFRLVVPSAYKALRDVQETLVRGSAWDNVDALSPMVKTKPADVSKETVGDLTLSTDYTASVKLDGDVAWSQVVELRIQISHDKVNAKELMKIKVDDLFSSKTVKGNSGWAGKTYTVKTQG